MGAFSKLAYIELNSQELWIAVCICSPTSVMKHFGEFIPVFFKLKIFRYDLQTS